MRRAESALGRPKGRRPVPPPSRDHITAIRRLDYVSAPLIVLSAVSIAFGPDIGDGIFGEWINLFEVALSVLFTTEYVVRLHLGGRRYAFSFYGVIDLLAGVPGLVILAGGHELLAIRVLRLFRLLSLLKLARFGGAAARLGAALDSVRAEFALLAATVAMMLFLAAIGIRHFEAQVQPEHFSTFADCLWWAVVSLTTVGYGDAYPITAGGKAFASIILIISLAIVAVPAGLIAAALSAQGKPGEREE